MFVWVLVFVEGQELSNSIIHLFVTFFGLHYVVFSSQCTDLDKPCFALFALGMILRKLIQNS